LPGLATLAGRESKMRLTVHRRHPGVNDGLQ